MSLIVVTSDTFEAKVLKSDKPVLVEFGAEWCQPCKVMLPLLEKMAEKHPEYKFCSVDIDDSSDVSSRYKVRGAPTFMVFVNGVQTKSLTGTATEAKLLDLLK